MSRSRWRLIVREFGLVVVGKTASFGSLFLCGVLVARATEPAEYGLYAAGLAVLLILESVLGSPLDTATLRFSAMHRDQPQRLGRLQAAIFQLKVGAGAVLILFAWAARRQLATLFFTDVSRVGLPLVVGVCLMAVLMSRWTSVYMQTHLRFKAYAFLDVMTGACRLALVGILLLVGTQRADVFLGAYGIAAAGVFVVALRWIPRRCLFARWPGAADRREMISYVGMTTVAITLGVITLRGEPLILAGLHSPREAGYYGAAFQVSLLMSIAASLVSILVQPRVLPLARSGELRALLRYALSVGALLGVIGAMVILPQTPAIVHVLYGPVYEPVVPVLRVLIVASCVDLLGSPVLMPIVVQLFPRALCMTEALTAICFLIIAPLVAINAGAVGMAWIVLTVRVVKFALYAWIAFGNVDSLRDSNAPIISASADLKS